ncbi:hypothetical protein EON65_48575 [archaeon]|nr:MAG: hypothetical protein EON65_48575 [archaeon]
MPQSLLEILKRRELSPKPIYAIQLAYWADDSFAHAKSVSRHNLTNSSISTIAIAMAPDRSTFASTHGDHTVKVFTVYNNRQIRNFTGHPRTPWTVRYHPTDPDILASGCLGGRVGNIIVIVVLPVCACLVVVSVLGVICLLIMCLIKQYLCIEID